MSEMPSRMAQGSQSDKEEWGTRAGHYGRRVPVSHARIFPSLVRALGWKVNDQDSGLNTPGSLASYDLDTRSWRTSERSLFEDLTPFWDRLPKSGMMRNGKIYALPMSERPIDASESGLLPTPKATVSGPDFARANRGGSGGDDLVTAIARQMWPTPTGSQFNATDCTPKLAQRCHDRGQKEADGSFVERMAKILWPTPSATDFKGSGKTGTLRDRLDYATERGATKSKTYNATKWNWPTPRTARMCGGTGNWNQLKGKCDSIEEARKMGAGNGGSLNPQFVSWLMGYPINWTDTTGEPLLAWPIGSTALNASVTLLSLKSRN